MDNSANVKVTVEPDVTRDGEVVTYPEDVVAQLMIDAGWSSDPGTGKAILTPGGREIVSPRPVAPPVGYVKEESAMDRLARMLEQRILSQLHPDDVFEETTEEAEDFEVPDLDDIRYSYSLEMIDEVPELPRERPPSVEKKAADPVPDGGAKPDGDGGS